MIYTDKTHLIADSVAELHAFALKMGLKCCWFRNERKTGTRCKKPHYDLMGRFKQRAIDAGAIYKTPKELIYILRGEV